MRGKSEVTIIYYPRNNFFFESQEKIKFVI